MFGERLQQARKQLNLSQDAISTQIGISYRAYSSYEREDRKPPIDFLEKLVTLYNLNLNFLVAGKGNMFNAPQYEDVKGEILKEVDEILVKYGVKNL